MARTLNHLVYLLTEAMLSGAAMPGDLFDHRVRWMGSEGSKLANIYTAGDSRNVPYFNIYGRHSLKSKFDNIRHLFCYDCATGYGIRGIRANRILRIFLTSCSIEARLITR